MLLCGQKEIWCLTYYNCFVVLLFCRWDTSMNVTEVPIVVFHHYMVSSTSTQQTIVSDLSHKIQKKNGKQSHSGIY